MNRHTVLSLLGKGIFASAAVALMLGGDHNANAVQHQQAASASAEYRTIAAKPAPLTIVRASSNPQAPATTHGAQPRWVF